MGVDYTYFSAADDDAAAATIGRAGGPSSQEVLVAVPAATAEQGGWWRRRKTPEPEFAVDLTLPVLDTLELRGIDPFVQLATLEAIMTGRAYEDVIQDERHGRAVAEDDEGVAAVVTLTDSVRDALAAADEAELARVAPLWLRTEEFAVRDDEDREFFTGLFADLAALARRAHADELHLYCWMSV
ncbi:hypothetical protein GCM10028777_00880 [Angustibacter speluncae]